MTGFLMESVVLAFTLGGIFGAITALHLRNGGKVPVKIKDRRTGKY